MAPGEVNSVVLLRPQSKAEADCPQGPNFPASGENPALTLTQMAEPRHLTHPGTSSTLNSALVWCQ